MSRVRSSCLSTIKNSEMNAYAEASGCSGISRRVKAEIYGVGKPCNADGDRTARSAARTERIAEGVQAQGLVPHFAPDSAPLFSPINNMGENLEDEIERNWTGVCDEDLGQVDLVLTDSGKVKTMLVRRPATNQGCVIDWINFTVLEDTWFKTAREHLVSDDQIIIEASRQLEKIFGFGITRKRDKGMNFYRESWVLGDEMGFVCFGGQRSTMLITLTGLGCLNAVGGWEKRLYDFLTKTAIRPSISRIDLAHDDLEGDYLSVDWAEAQWLSGGFSFRQGGRPPEIQRLGNWHRVSGKGRTLTVGQRKSSKYCRFYEKGKKEGDKHSLWCRCEVEFKNTNSIIELDVLLNPTAFFVGAYPCFSKFASSDTPARMRIKERAAQITVDDCIAITKRQFGKYIRVLRGLFGDNEALDMITNHDEHAWPKRLKPHASNEKTERPPVHVEPQEHFPDFRTSTDPDIPSFIRFINTVPCFGLNGENGFA
ncbi:phage replication initiation protein [Massilia sp. MP_M2]|uniref:replication initiation factor domain-containing protein n=1 Tax=Massilia sp. MP_M2 TaxID=3071713 RepID=UPI00319EB1AD